MREGEGERRDAVCCDVGDTVGDDDADDDGEAICSQGMTRGRPFKDETRQEKRRRDSKNNTELLRDARADKPK